MRKDHATLDKQFQIRVLSLALLELSGWAFLLGAGASGWIGPCWKATIAMAPDGICSSLIFRTLLLLCDAESYGAPVPGLGFFVVSSRARGGFDGTVMLARVGAGMNETNGDK